MRSWKKFVIIHFASSQPLRVIEFPIFPFKNDKYGEIFFLKNRKCLSLSNKIRYVIRKSMNIFLAIFNVNFVVCSCLAFKVNDNSYSLPHMARKLRVVLSYAFLPVNTDV